MEIWIVRPLYANFNIRILRVRDNCRCLMPFVFGCSRSVTCSPAICAKCWNEEHTSPVQLLEDLSSESSQFITAQLFQQCVYYVSNRCGQLLGKILLHTTCGEMIWLASLRDWLSLNAYRGLSISIRSIMDAMNIHQFCVSESISIHLIPETSSLEMIQLPLSKIPGNIAR